ncbi:hypothetical protein OYE22_01470 [Streptomyces sp. 71268]|uniref:hypothetical protein n=1 Tax=Streptomyces sp. 71268 TaxID=3002640 RepID=UPI0023F7E249|nr:hypothetical protein [Streptomyces sp. 71268]WEV24007.1 hypothetical protein OYE22_01470 [Streptomyces sp. 71268]
MTRTIAGPTDHRTHRPRCGGRRGLAGLATAPHPPHPAYRARFADDDTLDVPTDAEPMEAEVERFAGPADAAGCRRRRQ